MIYVRKIMILIFVLFLPMMLLAEDTLRYRMPEQIVTTTRSVRSWLDAPTAFTVLKTENQPAQRGLGISESLILVPGLVANSRFGTDDLRLSIRGMGARSNTGVRGVRVLYDGIPESEPDGQARLEGIDPGTVHSVEVLRGGGSALYGNAAGGVINLRTAETFPVAGLRADFTGSGYGYTKISLAAGTGPLHSDSTLYLSIDFSNFNFEAGESGGSGGTITLSRTESDGWRKHSKYEGYHVNGAWTIHADPWSSLRALFYFVKINSELPGTLTPEQFDDDPFQADSNYVALDVKRITRKGRLGLQYKNLLSEHFTLEFTPYAALKKFDRPREKGSEYRLLTRYMLGGTLQGVWDGFLANRPLYVVFGVDEQFQDGPISTYHNEGGTRTDSLLKEEQKSQWGQGVFTEGEIGISDFVTISAGARWDHVRFVEEILTEGVRITNDEQAVTPRFGLRYRVGPGMMAFGSLFGGFETPSRKETENSVGFNVKPQKTWTAEFGFRGVKIVKGVETRWDATIYRMTVTDMIVPDILSGEELFTNAGEAVHQGIELSARLSKPRLGFMGVAASLGEYRFTDYISAFGDFSDKKLPGVSPNIVSGVVRWTPDDAFYAEFSGRVSGAAYANTENFEKADAWLILNTTIGGKLPIDFLSCLWHIGVQNITDERYVSFIQVNDSKRRYFEMGMPRTVLAGLRVGTPGL